MLSDEDIFNRAQVKQAEFQKRAEVTLIGHSLFDMWDDMVEGTPKLGGKSVANLGLSGTSTRQYLDAVIKKGLITHLGDTVFLFLGVNDIVKEPKYSPAQVVDWLAQIVSALRQIAPDSRYFLLEATPVNQIATVDNPQILEMNQYLETHCPTGVHYVKTWAMFANENGMLDRSLCHDGLHFTQKGYDKLTYILERYL
ncbi:acylneuraminate cytidylyltransferase [Pasteurellaceae bacterium Macca]|nr:acylneuraminate cytidylyltransferase [Pasteurellaceae bacterium Macca]